MKITVFAGDIVSAMRPVVRVAKKYNTIPILSHALLQVDDARLVMTGTNMDVTVRSAAVSHPASRPEAGLATMDARCLCSFARSLPSDALVEIATDETQISLSALGTLAKLQTLPPSDFPAVDATEEVYRFWLSSADALRLFGRTQHAISREETRYYLNGTFLSFVDEGTACPRLCCTATDGHRLAEVSMSWPTITGPMPSVIVPRKAVNLLLEEVTASPGTVLCTLHRRTLNPPKPADLWVIAFAVGSTEIISKTIDGTFPDYNRVIPNVADSPGALRVARKALTAGLSRVSTFSDEDATIRMEGSNAGITLAVQSHLNGEPTTISHEIDRAEFEMTGTFAPVGLKLRYVKGLIEAIDEDADIEFIMSAILSPQGCQTGPVIARQIGDEFSRFVLMPMRIF